LLDIETPACLIEGFQLISEYCLSFDRFAYRAIILGESVKFRDIFEKYLRADAFARYAAILLLLTEKFSLNRS
jgi:hypothetical protein